MDGTVWWGPFFGAFWIFPVLCLLGMVAMAVVMMRFGGAFGCCLPMGRGRETPQQIADRRFAKGELTREQYDTMRRDLGGTT